MTTPIWKILPLKPLQQIQVVFRVWPDGKQESCQVTAEEYVKWIEDGNTPEPADNTQQGATP